MEMVPKNNILGSEIANLEPDEVVATLEAAVERGEVGYVCVSNVHTTVTGFLDREFREITNDAYLAVPDGTPLIWAHRLLNHGPAQRTYGPALMQALLSRAADRGHTHFFFGGSEETIAALRERFGECGSFGPTTHSAHKSQQRPSGLACLCGAL